MSERRNCNPIRQIADMTRGGSNVRYQFREAKIARIVYELRVDPYGETKTKDEDREKFFDNSKVFSD